MEEYKTLMDPLTRESAKACVVDTLRAVGGDDYEGWRMVLESMLNDLDDTRIIIL